MSMFGHPLTLQERLFYAIANIERGAWPAAYILVNQILPLLAMPYARGDHYELIRNVPYRHIGEETLMLDIVKPHGPGPFPVVVGIHGGGWTLGRKENIRHAAAYFARRGILAALINYRLAPKHPWPACADDVRAALGWVKAHIAAFGGDGTRVGVFGDSAGAHLSAYAAVAFEPQDDRGLPQIAAAVHWYGVFDFERFARIPWRRAPQLLRALFGNDRRAWAQASPRACVERARSVPPTLLFAAGGDPLYSQSLDYAHELERRGAVVKLKKYTKTIHGFLNLPFSPECRASLRHSAAWFQQHLA